VEDAGGLKKFASKYPLCFQWVSGTNAGRDAVRLVKDGSQSPSPLEALTELIEWHGGKLLASKLLQELRQRKPHVHGFFKREVDYAGGVKKFVAQHADRFEWVVGAGPGTDVVRVAGLRASTYKSSHP